MKAKDVFNNNLHKNNQETIKKQLAGFPKSTGVHSENSTMLLDISVKDPNMRWRPKEFPENKQLSSKAVKTIEIADAIITQLSEQFSEKLANALAEQIGLVDRLRRMEAAIVSLQQDRPSVEAMVDIYKQLQAVNDNIDYQEKERFQRAFLNLANLSKVNEYNLQMVCNHLGIPFRSEMDYTKSPRKPKKVKGAKPQLHPHPFAINRQDDE